MKIFKFINNTSDYWLIGIVLIVALVLFIRDFKLTSLRSWLLLIGLFAVGAIAILKVKRNKRLREKLAEREKELEKLEEKYNKLKEVNKISEENYQLAKKELGEKKKLMALDVLKANEKYQKEAAKLEKEIKTTSPEDMIKKVNAFLLE